MQAGKLREKVTFYRTRENDWGEPDGFEAVKTLAAEVTEKGGSEGQTDGAQTSRRQIEIKTRFSLLIDSTMQAEWFDEKYRITTIIRDARRRFLTISAERLD